MFPRKAEGDSSLGDPHACKVIKSTLVHRLQRHGMMLHKLTGTSVS